MYAMDGGGAESAGCKVEDGAETLRGSSGHKSQGEVVR